MAKPDRFDRLDQLDPQSVSKLLDAVRTVVREELSNGPIGLVAPLPPDSPSTPAAPSDLKPILLRDSHRQLLERLFGGPMLSSPEDVIQHATRLSMVAINDPHDSRVATLVLPLDTIERLDSRRPIDTSMQELLTREIGEFLERYINGDF